MKGGNSPFKTGAGSDAHVQSADIGIHSAWSVADHRLRSDDVSSIRQDSRTGIVARHKRRGIRRTTTRNRRRSGNQSCEPQSTRTSLFTESDPGVRNTNFINASVQRNPFDASTDEIIYDQQSNVTEEKWSSATHRSKRLPDHIRPFHTRTIRNTSCRCDVCRSTSN